MQKTGIRFSPSHSDRPRRHRKRAAFTLVEVMMACTVMVVGLCGGLSAIQSGFKAIDSARCSTLSAQIMQSQIERLRLLNWTDLSAQRGSDVDVPTSALVPSTASDIASRFTLKQTVQLDGARSDVMEIRLNVTWKGVGNINQSRSFVTRYAKNGLYDYYFSRH